MSKTETKSEENFSKPFRLKPQTSQYLTKSVYSYVRRN
ncbi:hypothetical protein LAC30SC_08010 [Lactobacillus amylovorus]|uniref:Uncharacterized protein n=1 Tax=Lactobacillus amylovorus TaxID=1604 RepID=F0TG59_LACAM|nr:hypothetical protein LAC30SC_08010 [Lactobacillus amylovorus]